MSLVRTLRFITAHPLNRAHKLQSIVRYARWQIGSRLVAGPVVHEWVNGARFLVRNGETGLTGNIYTGLHEFEDMAYLLHVLRPEDLFVDVGANVGSYTLLACRAAGAEGIAFEPVPAAYARLVENVRLNRLEERVRCISAAVGASPGVLAFTSGEDTTNHALAAGEHAPEAIEVSVTTLDAALAGRTPAMLKIDVEGWETPVLDGADRTLAHPGLHSIVMELNGSGARYGFDEADIVRRLAQQGFTPHAYDAIPRTLTPLDGRNASAGNTLFVRDRPRVEARLASSPRFSLHGTAF